MFFPLESFDFIDTQSAIQCIKENIHFFASFFICNEFSLILCEQTMSLGGFHGLMLQKKIFRSKIVTTKEGLETTNNDLTFIPYCEFQREGFARDWLLLGLFQLIVLRTLQPCSAKGLAGGWWGEIISCRKFFFSSLQSGKTASWISQWFNSLVHRADICFCRSTYSVNSVEKRLVSTRYDRLSECY